jgi:RimJ/RimL family protein N-acetyltransferase
VDAVPRSANVTFAPWHDRRDPDALADFVGSLLTDSVTRALPPDWKGPFDRVRAMAWIDARDRESTVLLIETSDPVEAIGLVLLHDGEPSVVRFGYLLAERAWGRGLGTEVIQALARWARHSPNVDTLVGGVDDTNAASIRVLTKCGFERTGTLGPGHSDFTLSTGSVDQRA